MVVVKYENNKKHNNRQVISAKILLYLLLYLVITSAAIDVEFGNQCRKISVIPNYLSNYGYDFCKQWPIIRMSQYNTPDQQSELVSVGSGANFAVTSVSASGIIRQNM